MSELESVISHILGQYHTVQYLRIIKSGKEATVHLLNVDNNLMALKVYKSNTKFSSRNVYFDISEIGDKRLIRGAKKKTERGLEAIKNSWIYREFKILKELYDLGALVPKPILIYENSILMEYLGNIYEPAPRLSEIKVHKDIINRTLNIILDHIELFKELGFTHGDLSASNILWFNEKPYIIDFPQVVYDKNKNFKEKYKKDLDNIMKYFNKLMV